MTELIDVHHALLPAVPPFSLACSLRALSGFAPCSGDQLVVDGRVRKAFAHPTDPSRAVVVDVGPRGDGVPGVDLRVYAEAPLPAEDATAVELLVDRWLSLSDDLSGFLRVARADPPLAPLLDVTAGLHQVRFADLAEGAVYFTLTQRSTQWFAASRKRRIAAERGPRGVVDGVSYVAFPALGSLAALGTEVLVGYAGSRQRAARLHDVLTGVAALDEDWLRTGPYDDVRAALLQIPGVGGFTAHAILLRVLGRPDDVPLEMTQFTKVAAEVYGEPAPTPDELRARFGSWVGWWAYLARTAAGWLAADNRSGAASAKRSSQRNSVRTPQPVAPFASSASALSAQDADDMSTWTQRSRSGPANSLR
jgi:DNA-3-methyladenine glycosylase II